MTATGWAQRVWPQRPHIVVDVRSYGSTGAEILHKYYTRDRSQHGYCDPTAYSLSSALCPSPLEITSHHIGLATLRCIAHFATLRLRDSSSGSGPFPVGNVRSMHLEQQTGWSSRATHCPELFAIGSFDSFASAKARGPKGLSI